MNGLNKPWKHKNWLIWPKTIISNFDEMDCADSNSGFCYKNKTIEQCLSTCLAYCNVGYHIKLSDGSSICLPFDNTKYVNLSPYNFLKPQSTTNLKNMEISTFVNTNAFPFPPKNIRNILFKDNLVIKSGNSSIGTLNQDKINNSNVVMNNNNLVLNILPSVTLDNFLVENLEVNFNQKILINIPNTDIIINKKDEKIIWDKILLDFNLNDSFELISLKKEDINQPVKLGDKFKIKLENYFISVSEDNTLSLNKYTGSVFEIISKEKGYYCQNKTCKSVQINNDTIKIHNISRRSDCFNLCQKNSYKFSDKPPKNKSLLWLYIIIAVIVIIIISVVFSIYRVNR